MNWLDLLQLICSLLKPKVVPLPDTKSVTSDVIQAALLPFGGNLWLSDGVFKYMTVDSMTEFLSSDDISMRPYKEEEHDCDDFSYELMGHVSEWNSDNTFGIVWGLNADGDGHAWNFFVDETNKVWFVEPQNNCIFEPTTEKVWMMIV